MENETKQAQDQLATLKVTGAGSAEGVPTSRPRNARQWQRERPGYAFLRCQSAASIAALEVPAPIIPRAVGSKKPSIALDSDWPQSSGADCFTRGEQAMWRAVILQALTDAACESHKYEARLEREKARRWLLAAGPDFRTVCDYAGFEPERVKRWLAGANGGLLLKMAVSPFSADRG